ncbi:1410_t:CDS:2 [Paraglomus occultum]|uniref:1410_t:CDS:1 n=1 Tax=Paraglomus occultum TaxID=144539 RepID=A0A9N9BNE5_9GLOM|nr:1410_t:CDS:2 [Paraglomus occultum]
MTNTTEQVRRPDEHRKQIEKSIKEGVLKCYSKSEIVKRRMAIIAAGGWGVIFKGIIEASGEPVAIKKLCRGPYVCQTTVNKMLAKETSSNILIKDGIVKITDFGLSRHIGSSSIGTGNTSDHTSVSFDKPELDQTKVPGNVSSSSDDPSCLNRGWIRRTRTMLFEKILKPKYDLVCRKFEQIKIQVLESNPCLWYLYTVLTNTLESDDPFNSLYATLGEIRSGEAKELAKLVESNTLLYCLHNVVVAVVEVLAKVRAIFV